FPASLSGLRLQRFHRAVVLYAQQVAEAAPFEQLAGTVFFLHLEVGLGLLIMRHHVKKAGERAPGRALPVSASAYPRVDDGSCFCRKPLGRTEWSSAPFRS